MPSAATAFGFIVALGMLAFFCLQMTYFVNNLDCECALFGNVFTIVLICFCVLCMMYSILYVFKYGRALVYGPEFRYVEV